MDNETRNNQNNSNKNSTITTEALGKAIIKLKEDIRTEQVRGVSILSGETQPTNTIQEEVSPNNTDQQEITQPLKPVEIKEIETFKPHDLDEFGERTLDAKTRVIRHQEMVDRIAKGAENGAYGKMKESYDFFTQDVIAAESYIAKRKIDGKSYTTAAFAGQTLSDIDGLIRTSHVMYTNIKDPEAFAALTQEQRQDYFVEKVVPKIQRVVVNVHGWGGRLVVFEAGNMVILNESHGRVNKMDVYAGAGINQIPQIDEGTLMISLDVMGSGKSLDEINMEQFTPDKIPQQVWEAIDRMGFQFTTQKLKHITSQGYMSKKVALTQELEEAIYNKKNFTAYHENRLRELLWLHREEAEIANGVWWNNLQAVEYGHSMGGTSTNESAIANIAVERPQILKYRENWKLRKPMLLNIYRQIIEKSREYAMLNQEGDIVDFDNKLKSEVNKIIKIPSSSLGHYPFQKYQINVPVIAGDNFGVKEFREDYSWLLKDQNKRNILKELVQHLPLHKEASSAIIHFVHFLEEKRLKKPKDATLKAGDITHITDIKLGHHIGKTIEETTLEAHRYTLKEETTYERWCSQNLRKLKPAISDKTLVRIPMEKHSELLSAIRIYANDRDKTVKSGLTKLWGFQLEGSLLDKGVSPDREFMRVSKTSNHYPDMNLFRTIQSDMYDFLEQYMKERYAQLDEAIKELYPEFSGGRQFGVHNRIMRSPQY